MINADEGLVQALMDVYIMEKGINQFYGDVASKAGNEETRKTFSDLAGWEAEHARYIQFLYQGLMEDWDLVSFEEFSKGVKPEIVEGGMPLEELEGKIEEFTYLDDLGAIDFALKVEAKEYNLYRQLASQASKTNMKVLFEELMGWEQKHIEYLKKLKSRIGNT
ncbi:MAG: ferritin family protein [Candidatus Sulfobium sp.]|jgi:rubrerythrin